MSDKKKKSTTVSKDPRLIELEEQLKAKKFIDARTYLKMLLEIRHRATIRLNMACVSGFNKGAITWLNIMEKTHYMIDSIEPQKVDTTKDKDLGINFQLPDYDDEQRLN